MRSDPSLLEKQVIENGFDWNLSLIILAIDLSDVKTRILSLNLSSGFINPTRQVENFDTVTQVKEGGNGILCEFNICQSFVLSEKSKQG